MSNFLKFSESGKRQLIIFPHAGGLPFQYQAWSEKLSQYFDVIYCHRPKSHNWTHLIEQSSKELKSLLKSDAIFFGHSMGALMAYYLSLELSEVQTVVLSGMNPPTRDQKQRFTDLANMNLDSFEKFLLGVGGIAESINSNAKESILFSTQNDFKLLGSLDLEQAKVISKAKAYPVTGIEDKICQVSALSNWNQHFNELAAIKVFPGDHFFLFSHHELVHQYLVELN